MINEDAIRDYLAKNLGMLDNDLMLIKKEFKLNNRVGAKGFIDLLARDVYNNFVIIEIKRTKASSRETIQELLKYIALIKQNYHAKESEIKTIIVSIDWTELLVPFSELVRQTSLTVKGIKLITDENGIPHHCEVVEPLVEMAPIRKFASSYSIYFFSSATRRDQAIKEIEAKTTSMNIFNYVLLEMNGNPSNDRLVHTFSLCVAFQQLSIENCLKILENSESYLEEEIDFDDQEHELEYFNECLATELNFGVYSSDGLEHGTQKNIQAAFSNGTWNLAETHLYGIYLIDPRFNQEILLREIMGLDGSNDQAYLNFCESTHHERLTEIMENCQRSLASTASWKKYIKTAFQYLSQQREPYRLVIRIYTQPSILLGIAKTMTTDDSYLPSYTIFIDFLRINRVIIFEGNIGWNGKEVAEDEFLDYLKNDDDYVFISKAASVVDGYYEPEVLRKLQLRYQNYASILDGGKLTNSGQAKIKNNEIVTSKIKDKELIYWLQAYPNLMPRVVEEFRRSTFGLV